MVNLIFDAAREVDVEQENRPIGLGVCGLGRAFTLMLPTFSNDPRFRLVGAADPDARAKARFSADFDAPVYDDIGSLCQNPQVEAVYIASPHQFHAHHVEIAAAAGKHILVEKPMAISLPEGERIIAAADKAGICLIVGPSHSFDAPVAKARQLIESGEIGPVRMIQSMNYTDFLYRPRRPEELDTKQGGGVIFSQAVHQVDVVRALAGGLVDKVYAVTGNWDKQRSTEGAYGAMLTFENGAFANLTYSGYAHYDSDELMDWSSELGQTKNPDDYGKARRALRDMETDEAETKRQRNYGHEGWSPDLNSLSPSHHEHFGFVLVSCEMADIRLTPSGIWVMGNEEKTFLPVDPPAIPRQEVMDGFYSALREGKNPLQTGAWGLASLEVCLGLLESANGSREIKMTRQISAQ